LPELPGLGFDRVPERGLDGPPKLGFGFQPGPDFLSAREAELEKGLAALVRKSEAPSSLGV